MKLLRIGVACDVVDRSIESARVTAFGVIFFGSVGAGISSKLINPIGIVGIRR